MRRQSAEAPVPKAPEEGKRRSWVASENSMPARRRSMESSVPLAKSDGIPNPPRRRSMGSPVPPPKSEGIPNPRKSIGHASTNAVVGGGSTAILESTEDDASYQNQRRASAPNLSAGRQERQRIAAEQEQEKEAKRRCRKLSFVDCSLKQIEDAISSVGEGGYPYNASMWDPILSGAPSQFFRPLQNRTLTFWVKCFNKWLEFKTTDVNGVQLQDMMFISKQSLSQIVDLYDAEGSRRLRSGGITHANLSMVRIPAIELMIAGVMLSRLISTRNKISFAFGLVDCDCSRSLNRHQFAAFIRCFMCGLGSAFGIACDSMPSKTHINTVVHLLYTRISAAAISRVKDIYARGNNQVKSAVVQAIKARQTGVERGVIAFKDKLRGAADGQALSYQVLCDWCSGVLLDQDPLALPFRLAIMRFCPMRQGDFADEFDDSLKEFQLSHEEPVLLPEDGAYVDGKDMLNRAEVAYTHEVLNYCHSNAKVVLSGEEMNSIANQFGISVSRQLKTRLMSAMETMSRDVADFRSGGKVSSGGLNSINLISVLRKLCPSAQTKHLRMYEVWCEEYTSLSSKRDSVEHLEQATAQYMQNDQKPFMPPNELELLNREFDALDKLKRGYITLDDIALGWQWSSEIAGDTLSAYDLTGDGYIDRSEFLRMMCPSEYRLPEMAGLTRQLFGKVLTTTVEQLRKEFDNTEIRFTDAGTEELPPPLEAPRAVLPVVSAATWAEWQSVFDSLDRNGDGKVHKKELMQTGLLSHSACAAITELIDPEDAQSFTRKAFLNAMLQAHDCREPTAA